MVLWNECRTSEEAEGAPMGADVGGADIFDSIAAEQYTHEICLPKLAAHPHEEREEQEECRHTRE